jgi:hypothetical protein
MAPITDILSELLLCIWEKPHPSAAAATVEDTNKLDCTN